MVDDGLTTLREIDRILALTTGRSSSPSGLAASRVLDRIEPYKEAGRSPSRTDDAPDDGTALDSLLPPNLRLPLVAALTNLASTHCLVDSPRCGECEIRKLCGQYRSHAADTADANDSLSAIDLFAGAGGVSEGFRRAGYRILGALDADPQAAKTYRFNHPSVPTENVIVGDIREVPTSRLKSIAGGKRLDVLIGAPPCQGFSSAGHRSKSTQTGYRVTSDKRNYLSDWLIDLAIELKPRLFLMENVPGMQTAKKDNLSFLDSAARRLGTLGGYRTTVWKLNAAAFGVPQERIRCFLVGAAPGISLPTPPAEEYQNARRADYDTDSLPPVTLNEAIFDLPPREAGGGTAVELLPPGPRGTDIKLRRYLAKFRLLSSSRLVFNHHARYQNARDLELYGLLKPGQDSVHAIEVHGREDLMRYRRDVFDDKYARLRADRPSKTIVSHLAKDGNGYIHPSQVRGITPREAARVQSFPDDYAFCGSTSDQWVQIGNAVPPILAQNIALSFASALRRKNVG